MCIRDRDYSALEIKDDSYWANIERASQWDFNDMIAKAGKPVDKDEWLMTPQTVNAYYNPTTNEICFPAAILQAPFFDMNADDAMNYGAIGVVIGHEMTHGFDDQGRQYDKDGNLKDWWTEEDAKKFEERAQDVYKRQVEYRFRIFKSFWGATFLDAGNVWLLRKDRKLLADGKEARPNSQLRLKTFPKQIALGTGVGIRYDMDILVFRLDFGIPLHLPYDTDRSGYYNVTGAFFKNLGIQMCIRDRCRI